MKVVIIIEGNSEEATVRYEIPKHVSTTTDSHICFQHPIRLADVMMEAADKYLKELKKKPASTK